ncbi:radical SAM family heme chaperone HemW [Erythrobacter dokdonensis]|uniref:Heme chaperone HemW n=1 Tax=Erythrobacter dokdonensis DSW-74 TaxID=1300349 RepID=A0A1A7BMB7_9SPHN|nr:radical SAM family heme chaperone HemW [Erythrobacter dokdonensis]OBV12617.1 Coproporphyrinogen III oxidase [Erythrobacter dokdonensis DSW-74]
MARALYIHWPFCAKKCPYCDFNSHVRESVDVAGWQAALIADMRAEAEVAGGAKGSGALTSIFFGGGTPSLMPPALVAALLAEAERLWGFDPAIEITLEANPSSVEAANFAALAGAGVNRVSLGVQSLDDAELRFLGRLHGAGEALRALEAAQAHFARVSFDMIYALPGHTPELWHDRLIRALSLGTGHLSLYQLTIEPGTRFASDVRRGRLVPLDDDAAAQLFSITQSLTEAAGLPAYETSNHARAGEESRHNLVYWRYQDYCGIGPGAHGRRGGVATVRHKKPENFLAAVERQGNGIAEARSLPVCDQAAEALLMGLRLTEGIDLAALSARFGLPRAGLVDEGALARLRGLGLVWAEGARIGVAPEGRGVLDALLAELVADTLVTV